MKWLTAGFVVLLVLIVIAANLGLGPTIFSFVYLIPGGDKVGHFVLMGLLSFLVNWVLKGYRVRVLSINLLKGMLIVMAVVTVEELSQIVLKNRGLSLVDLIFDYAGIILFGYLAAFLVNWRGAQRLRR